MNAWANGVCLVPHVRRPLLVLVAFSLSRHHFHNYQAEHDEDKNGPPDGSDHYPGPRTGNSLSRDEHEDTTDEQVQK